MPEADTAPGWGDMMDEAEGDELPKVQEIVENNIKKITEYKLNEDGKKVKYTRFYKLETRRVPKTIAIRKQWKKFGDAKHDNPHGPDTATTYVSDDVYLTLTANKEDLNQQDDDPLKKLQGTKVISCRICKGDHWTTKCPYKDSLLPQGNGQDAENAMKDDAQLAAASAATGGAGGTGKYVPPSLRAGGGQRRGETMQRRNDEVATVRVTNLSEETRESDLQELFRPFGPISRIFLAKDKITNQSKGFAFVSYSRREDAARAIQTLQGFGYDHLILNLEWARPSTNN